MKQVINEIIKKYRNKPLEYGTCDCNLLFMEIYEPEHFKTLFQRYTTIRGGHRVAKKETGFGTVLEFVEASTDYTEKPFDFAGFGDVLINGNEVAICLGTHVFSYEKDGVFTLRPLQLFHECRVFTKGGLNG